MDKEDVKNAIKIVQSLIGKLFYTFNDSASNPIIGKIAFVSGNKVRYYRFVAPGNSYNGFRDATIDELFDQWYISHEDLIEAAKVRRKEYVKENEEALSEVKYNFFELVGEQFANKLVEHERILLQKSL